MKLAAITGRATEKDYIDLYFIIKKTGLEKLLRAAEKKFPDINVNLFLKSIVYFKDLAEEPIIFKNNNKVTLATVKAFLQNEVGRYGRKWLG